MSERLVLAGSGSRQTAVSSADPFLLQNLIDMGFPEGSARVALEHTSNRSLEQAIDFMMNNPPSSAQPAAVAVAPSVPTAAAVPAAATPPQPKTDKVSSSFDIAAREAHKMKEMEERTRVVREEQKRKKEHQKKVKQQLEEDKMIRKMKPAVSKAGSLTAKELADHAASITAFLAENGRPCDDLAEIRTRLLAHAENMPQNSAAAAGAGSEPPHTAAAAPEHASQGARACQIRLRLGDGSQATQSLQSDASLQVLHDWVTERQGGDSSFTFIVPGPPGLRQELGQDKLALTLEELGLAPAASLTVQATSKKDLVTVAPEGSHFVSAQARGAFQMQMGGLQMQMGGLRSRGHVPPTDDVDEDGGEDEDEDEDEDDMDVGLEGLPATAEEEDAALARAQTESMDLATEIHFSQNRLGDGAGAMGAVGGHVLGGSGCSDSVTLGSGDTRSESKGALDEATLAGINALDLSTVRIPAELLDPLTQQLMTDPVKLPCSGSTMDRSTIMRHLRTSPTDPYTNTRLDPRNLAPATDLLPKYKAWLSRCQK